MSLKSFSIAAFAGITLLFSACSSENSTSTSEEIIDDSSASKDDENGENSSDSKSSESSTPGSSTKNPSSSSTTPEAFSSSANMEDIIKIVEDALQSAQISGCEDISMESDKWKISGSTQFPIPDFPMPMSIESEIVYDFTKEPATRTTTTKVMGLSNGEPVVETLEGSKEDIYNEAKKTCEAIAQAKESGNMDNLGDSEILSELFSNFSLPLLSPNQLEN